MVVLRLDCDQKRSLFASSTRTQCPLKPVPSVHSGNPRGLRAETKYNGKAGFTIHSHSFAKFYFSSGMRGFSGNLSLGP